MKNTITFIGIIVFAAVIGFTFTGCEEFVIANVDISGTAKVGATLTATSRGGGFSGNHGYEWGYANTAGSSAFNRIYNATGVNASQIVVASSHVGTYITARRWNEREGAYIYSKSIGPISN